MPRVTVLMAVYNGEHFVREAVESILGQSLQDFVFVIVEDGSTDQTASILGSYQDPRLRIVKNECNLGLTRSLNRGLELASSEFVARQDADDISEPERLAKQIAFLEKCPDVALVGTWYKTIDVKGQFLGNRTLPCQQTEICWALLFFCPFIHSGVMFRRSILTQVGLYNEALSYAQDYELWLRMARLRPVANLDEYLVRLRQHPLSMTATYGDRTREGEDMRMELISRLLNEDKVDMPFNTSRFHDLAALVLGLHTQFHFGEAERLVEEIHRLHPAFCQYFGLDEEVCAFHWQRVRYQLSRQLTRIAHHHLDQQDSDETARFWAAARNLDWRIRLTPDYARLSLRLLAGARYRNLWR